MTLFHTTSPEAAKLIVSGNFRPGHGGWCGGAIYFTSIPHLPKSKYNPKTTQGGAVIEVQVDMGRTADSTRPDGCNDGGSGRCCPIAGGGHGTRGAQAANYNSIRFNPGDGDEFLIWNPAQVLSKRILCEGDHQCYKMCVQKGYSPSLCSK